MMKVYQLDDDYALSRKNSWSKALKLAMVFVGLVWVVFLFDALMPFMYLNDYGIQPRQSHGLIGVLTAVFLHGNLAHIMSNTLPLLLAITALFGNYPKKASKVLFWGIVITGLLVWALARPANHIGASGVLYCLLSFLFFSGFIRRDVQSIGLSLVIAFLYGSLIFGVIPQKDHVSWESHLFGFLTGILLTWLYRKNDRPVYKSWDEEE